MWVVDWIKKRRNKKAFRVIAMNQGMQKIELFRLTFPHHKTFVTMQKTIVERIVEKKQQEILRISPIQTQIVQLHVHQRMYQPCPLQPKTGIPFLSHDMLRKEIRRLQWLGFLEEQEYFRTRPTMAHSLLQRMISNKPTYYLRGGEYVRPIHLEILKSVVEKETIQRDPLIAQSIEQVSPVFNYMMIQEVVREVSRQLQRERRRKGGEGQW